MQLTLTTATPQAFELTIPDGGNIGLSEGAGLGASTFLGTSGTNSSALACFVIANKTWFNNYNY